jgi:hypothetical protein
VIVQGKGAAEKRLAEREAEPVWKGCHASGTKAAFRASLLPYKCLILLSRSGREMLSQPVWICGPVGMETYTFQEKVSEKIVFVYATALCHLGQMNVFEFEFERVQ